MSRPWPGLSPSESGVAEMLCSGRTRQEISTFFGVSPKTYDTHRRRLLAKLHLRNEVDLLRWAISLGLVVVNQLDPQAARVGIVDGRDGASL